MAFKVRDLMISVAPSEPAVRSCSGKHTFFVYYGKQAALDGSPCADQCSHEGTHPDPGPGCGKETTHAEEPCADFCTKEGTHPGPCVDQCSKEGTHPGPCADQCSKEGTHPGPEPGPGCGKETTHPENARGAACGHPPYFARVDASHAHKELTAIRAQLHAVLAEVDQKIVVEKPF